MTVGFMKTFSDLKNDNFKLFNFSGLSRGFKLEPSDQTIPMGGTAFLQCQLESATPTGHTHWLKDDQPLVMDHARMKVRV